MNLRAVAPLLLISSPTYAAPGADAASTVQRLYRDYAWEAIMSTPGKGVTGLMAESRATLERYFDHALTDLIVQDNECSTRTREVCHLDFSPIWDGQDSGASGLTVSPTSDPTIVHVQFNRPNNPEPAKLTFALAKSAAGWRITDIKGANWDLIKVLRGEP